MLHQPRESVRIWLLVLPKQADQGCAVFHGVKTEFRKIRDKSITFAKPHDPYRLVADEVETPVAAE